MDEEAQAGGDPLGTAAIVVGCIGIVVAGALLAIVTALLAASAGAAARAAGRRLDYAYLAFALAVLDGVVWLALHLAFDLRFAYG